MSDIVLDKMKQLGVKPTRENYLDFAYLGTPPEKLSAEEEAMLPKGLTDETSKSNDEQAESA
jgi:hypothetical protein